MYVDTIGRQDAYFWYRTIPHVPQARHSRTTDRLRIRDAPTKIFVTCFGLVA